MMLNVVLIEPEIPWNTGNIGRTCLGVGALLHIVGMAGFSLNDRDVERAGLDYWKDIVLEKHQNLEEYLSKHPLESCYFFSARAEKTYTDIHFKKEDSVIFGCESEGLGPEILQKFSERCYRIPVRPVIRSLNLSTAAAIVIYEAQRQIGLAESSFLKGSKIVI
jgi:tRNA (cytidine/uridine-2'-O-)-methyltransferase